MIVGLLQCNRVIVLNVFIQWYFLYQSTLLYGMGQVEVNRVERDAKEEKCESAHVGRERIHPHQKL